MLKLYGVSTDEIYQEDFLKVGSALDRSTKGATIRSFRRAACS